MTTHSPLFRLEADAARQPQPAPLLLVSLDGFLDAGQVRSSVADHLLDTLEHDVHELQSAGSAVAEAPLLRQFRRCSGL